MQGSVCVSMGHRLRADVAEAREVLDTVAQKTVASKQVADLQASMSKLRNDRAMLTAEKSSLLARLAAIEAEADRFRTSIGASRKSQDRMQRQLKDQSEELHGLRVALEDKAGEVVKLRDEKENVLRGVINLQTDLRRAQSEAQALGEELGQLREDTGDLGSAKELRRELDAVKTELRQATKGTAYAAGLLSKHVTDSLLGQRRPHARPATRPALARVQGPPPADPVPQGPLHPREPVPGGSGGAKVVPRRTARGRRGEVRRVPFRRPRPRLTTASVGRRPSNGLWQSSGCRAPLTAPCDWNGHLSRPQHTRSDFSAGCGEETPLVWTCESSLNRLAGAGSWRAGGPRSRTSRRRSRRPTPRSGASRSKGRDLQFCL